MRVQAHGDVGRWQVFRFFSCPLQLGQVTADVATLAETAQVAASVLNLVKAYFCSEGAHVALLYGAATIVSDEIFAIES